MTTILIIEDEMHIRGNIAEVLELEYYDVLFAENGRIGVDLALEYVPDLIVCDVMMPEMDGFEVIQALQRAPETAMIPFIFLTALADRQSMRFAMELGADDYVVKPFMSDELLATIQTRLAKRAAALEMYRQLTADTPEAPPPEQAADDESGQQPLIGVTMRGYQIWEVIGQGGAGTVYRAYQGNLGREVAIKILRQLYSDDVESIHRFQTEAELVARLEHPHIIPLYDYWYDQHNVYLVMRLVRGGSLRDAILSRDRLDMAAAADMLDQVAGALAVAHSVGIVHRDIKPDNILLDERGNAYLTDFGLAKNVLSGVAEADESSQELQELLEAQDEFFADSPHSTLYFTDMDAITGTPAYLSPEHIQAGNLSPQSDIYSLGITLYEALTGWQPFQGSLVSIIEQQLEEPLPSIHQQFRHIPPMVDAVLQRATAKTPEERYADATAMAVDFRRACGLG